MNTPDTIRVVANLMYPGEYETFRLLSSRHGGAIGHPRDLYNSRATYCVHDESTYVHTGRAHECHGVAPITVNGIRHYQCYRRRYRIWVLTDIYYYGGFTRSNRLRNQPLYRVNLKTWHVIMFHECQCRFCPIGDSFNGYMVVRQKCTDKLLDCESYILEDT